ncbi:probable oxidoreductase, LLM family [Amycolatopsis xylanica]|uniref:Probable oxidoreductase, LLM family n=1 Tax=Amycolatopsis xylanica TaxID=589385 RepID=A0A1H2SC20_9PSEU|nr:LLM class flavin-dependent oxidoreductase [Amycolatopsis xylanica]SDW28684.1 probable oxidoreductase, LLM family [Amycolatopsis xylanica]
MAYEILGTRQEPTFGLDTFGDVENGADGQPVSQAEAIRQVVAEGVLADRVGVDYFGVGEHHRTEMAVSSPDVVLASIAGQTERIRLGTGVTVLSSDDPVRVYERFATLDALSNGRAEVTLGRGSFTESFPLFGYSLSDYEVLFAEKLDLFTKLQEEKPVTWNGTVRPALDGAQAYPVTESGGLPAWVGVGGTPQSVVRAAAYGLPLVMAVIGGSPERFTPLADLYRRALQEAGHGELPLGMHSPGHIAATDELAMEQHFPHHQAAFAKIGAERGWGPMSRADYDAMAGPRGALFVGSPETVAQKIAWAVRTLGLSRFQLKYGAGALPHEQRLESIRLYGEQVIPRVKELL